MADKSIIEVVFFERDDDSKRHLTGERGQERRVVKQRKDGTYFVTIDGRRQDVTPVEGTDRFRRYQIAPKVIECVNIMELLKGKKVGSVVSLGGGLTGMRVDD